MWYSDHTPTRWWGSLVFCIHSSRLSLFCSNHLQGRHYFCGRQTVENHLVHTSTNLYRHHIMTSSIPSWFIFSWFIFSRMQVCPQNHKNLHPMKFPAIWYYLQLPVMLMVVNLSSSAVGLWPWFCKSIGPHHDAKVDGWNLQVGSTGGDICLVVDVVLWMIAHAHCTIQIMCDTVQNIELKVGMGAFSCDHWEPYVVAQDNKVSKAWTTTVSTPLLQLEHFGITIARYIAI